jgi:hypothetical protein
LKFILLITKGILHDQHTRRMTMFVILISALVLLFAGWTFLNGILIANPVWFIGYWAVCAWLTFSAFLLAIYDLIAIRIKAQRERRALREEIFGADKRDL